MYGIMIRKFVLRGENKQDSVIEFKKGFNVIYGPSDTGKSLIVEYIDYVFGNSSEVKQTKYTEGFSYVLVEIESFYNNKLFTIARNIVNATDDILIEEKELSLFEMDNAQTYSLNKKGSRLLSDFYLENIGCEYRNIYSNKRGETKRFSFRNFIRFALLDENRISDKTSIVFATSSTHSDFKNFDALNTLNVILTGTKIETVEKADLERQKTLIEGMIIAIQDNIINIQKQNAELEKKKNCINIQNLYDIKNAIVSAIEEKKGEIQKINNRTSFLKKELREQTLQMLQIDNEIEKLSLLRNNYLSDRGRLEFIHQSTEVNEELIECKCPICNSKVSTAEIDPNFKRKIIFEVKHINTLIDSIDFSLKNYNQERNKVKANTEKIQLTISEIEKNDAIGLAHELSELIKKLNEVSSKIYIFQKYTANNRSILKCQRKIDDLKQQIQNTQKEKIDTNLLTDKIYEELSAIYKKHLVKCNIIKEEETVIYNKEKKDFIINGQEKAAFGKGTRSILNSFFALSIMEYCNDQNLCHPNLIILDSPVATYYEENNVDRQNNMDSMFYNEMAINSNNKQVLIFENREPKNLSGNIIHFVKEGEGRKGFIQ